MRCVVLVGRQTRKYVGFEEDFWTVVGEIAGARALDLSDSGQVRGREAIGGGRRCEIGGGQAGWVLVRKVLHAASLNREHARDKRGSPQVLRNLL